MPFGRSPAACLACRPAPTRMRAADLDHALGQSAQEASEPPQNTRIHGFVLAQQGPEKGGRHDRQRRMGERHDAARARQAIDRGEFAEHLAGRQVPERHLAAAFRKKSHPHPSPHDQENVLVVLSVAEDESMRRVTAPPAAARHVRQRVKRKLAEQLEARESVGRWPRLQPDCHAPSPDLSRRTLRLSRPRRKPHFSPTGPIWKLRRPGAGAGRLASPATGRVRPPPVGDRCGGLRPDRSAETG
jgi:hypothetical protein